MKVNKDSLAQYPKREALGFLQHLPNFVRLFTRLLRDPRVSWGPRLMFLASLVYAVSPLDFLVDVLPLIGVVDDVGVLMLACRWFVKLCPQQVVQEHVQALDGAGEWAPFGVSAN